MGLPGDSEVKNPPANSVDSWIQTLSQEYPLKREMAARYSILAWEIPWTEELGGLWSMGLQKGQIQLSD